MKKMIVMLSIVLLVLATECYGAVSDDVYVRKDVFEVYMQNINAKFDMIMEELKEQRKVMILPAAECFPPTPSHLPLHPHRREASVSRPVSGR